jgi:hypothetical protein
LNIGFIVPEGEGTARFRQPGQAPPSASGMIFEFDGKAMAKNQTFSHTFNLVNGQNFALFNYH